MRILIALFGTCILVAAPQQANRTTAAQAKPYRAIVDRYCVTCHNQKLRIAKLALDQLDIDHPEKDPLMWERAIRKLRGGMMPPPGAPRPPTEAVNELGSYLEDALDRAEDAKPNPGSVRIHRLNRTEYANAMRDLFDIEVDAPALLPADDLSDGFDNIAKALKVSPSFLDQYILAARAVARQAVGNLPVANAEEITLRGIDPGVPMPPGAHGGVAAKYIFPYEGDYELRATGNPALVTVDGVIADPRGRTHLAAGEHSLVSVSAPRSLVESEGALQGFIPGAAGTGYSSTGTVVGSFTPSGSAAGGRPALPVISVKGPFNPAGAPAESVSRRRIFLCRPPDSKEEAACASRILSNLARKAWRRRVAGGDLVPILRFYSEGTKAGTFENGIEGGVVAILASSKFLYRTERPPADAQPGTVYNLSGTELASRLSFFLWSSIPDEELLQAAEEGRLADPRTLERQVRRMLADPRAGALVTNFAFEWLKIRDLAALEPDPVVYPAFDAPLSAALCREMELFVGSVFREDRGVVDLLSADYSFVNERLAAHYGIDNVRGDQFRRITLNDPNRFGLLGKGAVLMVTAYPNRTSPVLRGAYILENIAGTPPAPPPPNVEAFKENKDGEKPKTIREIMEAHRASPTCNACHGVMDPLGFSLENFDTIGAYRSLDRFTHTKIDTSGKLADGTAVSGPGDLRKALLSRPGQFAQTFTEKMMTYALGRTIEYFDMPVIRRIVREAKAGDYRFSSIVLGIVKSPEFQSSVVEEQPRQVAAR
jgi:hypothetical protein